MSKVFKNKRKTVTAAIAVLMTAVIIFGGTFAWQSISQTALNEVAATVNPGGRLHDDFVDVTAEGYETMTFNKDVYVENFTSMTNNGAQIYARIRLDEYMEIGTGAGNETGNEAVSLIDGAQFGDKSTWTTHIPGKTDDPFHKYWTWDLDGQTTYMPTFNKDKSSLDADINGIFRNNFEDYVDYAGVTTDTADDMTEKTAMAVYERDTDGNITKEIEETHTVKQTLDAGVITMAQYLARLNDDNPNNDTGNFWVYDEDGWAYWANPINPDTATGLLLDQIQRTNEIINDDWYYGINVVAQFITGDDMGQEDGTGFYDDKDGSVPPSDNALLLLNKIGVDVTFEVETADDLKIALARGGNVTLTNDITVDTNLVVTEDTVLNLGNYTISVPADADGIYNEDTKVWSLISVQGAGTILTIDGGNFVAKEGDSFAVDVRDGARVVINDGNFVGNISAVYVHTGSALINGGTFSIQQANTTPGEGAHDQMINAYDESYANETAKITICGGTFYGFNPTAANDGNFVPSGYDVTNTDGVYTVDKVATSADEVTE